MVQPKVLVGLPTLVGALKQEAAISAVQIPNTMIYGYKICKVNKNKTITVIKKVVLKKK